MAICTVRRVRVPGPIHTCYSRSSMGQDERVRPSILGCGRWPTVGVVSRWRHSTTSRRVPRRIYIPPSRGRARGSNLCMRCLFGTSVPHMSAKRRSSVMTLPSPRVAPREVECKAARVSYTLKPPGSLGVWRTVELVEVDGCVRSLAMVERRRPRHHFRGRERHVESRAATNHRSDAPRHS